jgi:hypothetical protein
MTRLVFKIQGMDCPEEVAVLRRAVGPVVGGADRMSCDLLNGTMTVSLPEGVAHPGPIVQAVRKTGMHASLWQEEEPLGANHDTGKPWQRWGRPLLCLLSALCLGSGMGWQVLSQEHGFLALISSATPGTAMLRCHCERGLVRGAQGPLCATHRTARYACVNVSGSSWRYGSR